MCRHRVPWRRLLMSVLLRFIGYLVLLWVFALWLHAILVYFGIGSPVR